LYWRKVNLTCNSVDANLIEEILIGYEAISISLFDEIGDFPIYEPKLGETPLWSSIKICALFDKDITKGTIVMILKDISYTNLTISKLENQNWVKKYQENFKPIQFGERLWVVPSWYSEFKEKGRINLKLDPGMAFGSGSHETTHLCLEYLEKAKLDGLTILDYGCGSGILSIASLLMEAKEAIAIDIDPQALTATMNNSKINNVYDNISIGLPGSFSDTRADVLVANILTNSLIDLRDEFINTTKANGKLILSGVKGSQVELLIKSYDKFAKLISMKERNDWFLLEFINNKK